MVTKPTSSSRLLATALGAALALPVAARAQIDADATARAVPGGIIVTPGSSIARPEDRGRRVHTNVKIFLPRGAVHRNDSKPSGIYETPASLACLYGLVKPTPGCNPKTVKTVATGGSRTIAIVDAFDYPTAAADLAAYSAQFGLPAVTATNFQVVYASGAKPKQDKTGGWELEAALDIEMAHAMAPNANIILVEAANNGNAAMLAADKVAAGLVAAAGGGELSDSWGGAEFAKEETTEGAFNVPGVVFFASAGDSPGTLWPSVLSNVVGVGGTTIIRTAGGKFVRQESWSDFFTGATGGGASQYVARPSFQDGVAKVVGTQRGAPDVALVADPSSGVWVYDTTPYSGSVLNWVVIGGTSAASPAVAGIVNSAGSFRNSSADELATIYANATNKADYTDITKGLCFNSANLMALAGYDFCTGIGTPFGAGGK